MMQSSSKLKWFIGSCITSRPSRHDCLTKR